MKYIRNTAIGITALLFVFTTYIIFANNSSVFYLDSSDLALILTSILMIISTVLICQGIFTLSWILYAWNDPVAAKKFRSPRNFSAPHFSFTALIPARHEEKVIEDTIKAVDRINYPDALKEILVLCRYDDKKTIRKANNAIRKLNKAGRDNIKIIVFNSFPINKPHALNQGLAEAKNDIIAIFDAEDEPHSDIYQIVNTVMRKDKVDVVQSGVQLINFTTHWFSPLNVMEYYFWFKSGLHFFNKIGGVTPLGGNTVFFKKGWLNQINGWDEKCLTEDADIGIRLALSGAKTKIVYDEKHTTREETPHSVNDLIKQRTRWNQGFLQIFAKGEWNKLPKIKQRLTLLYILLSPLFLSLLFFYLPLGILISNFKKLPILVSLYSISPLYILGLLILTAIIGSYKFTKDYEFKYPLFTPLKIIVTFYPYLFILMISSLRAFYRLLSKSNSWEKTHHSNAHRDLQQVSVSI